MLASCVQDKNPSNNIRKTPLHWAAENWNLALCKSIVTNVEEKNPQDIISNYTTSLCCYVWSLRGK